MTALPPAVTRSDSIAPPRVGRVLLVACWVAVLYGMTAVSRHAAGPRGAAAWISTLIFLLTFTAAVEWPAARRLLFVSGAAGPAMQFWAPGNGAFVAVVAAIAVAALRLDTRSGRVVAALSGGGYLAASVLGPHGVSLEQTVSVVPGLLFTYLGSTAVRRLREEQRRTAELLEEVIDGRDARIRAAALDERARLAREMHDVLAHTLSALSIQLEGTKMLAEQRSCDPAVTAALARSGSLAREGLGEARRAVGSLRDDALPGPDLLPQLARQFEDDTNVPCRLQIQGPPIDLSAETRLALYRIAQEALTNVRKHARASSVTITLRYAPEGTDLVVEDQGSPLAPSLPGGGYGLNGMRERAELIGGALEAGPTATGFRVRLWIPR